MLSTAIAFLAIAFFAEIPIVLVLMDESRKRDDITKEKILNIIEDECSDGKERNIVERLFNKVLKSLNSENINLVYKYSDFTLKQRVSQLSIFFSLLLILFLGFTIYQKHITSEIAQTCENISFYVSLMFLILKTLIIMWLCRRKTLGSYLFLNK